MPLKCPQGSLAKGLYVRHGSYVDALGISCQKVVPAGQAPAATGTLRLVGGYEFGPMTLDSTASFAVNAHSTGGAGGSFFEKLCPPNKAIVQFNMRSGVAIDQLHEIVCVDINDIAQGTTLSREVVPVNAGGSGGSDISLGTPANNHAMFGWNHKSGSDDNMFDGSWILTEFQAHSMRIGPAGVMPSDQADTGVIGQGSNGFGNSQGWFTNDCPPNNVLTGVKGRVGGAVDNLAGICQAVHLGN